MKTKNLVPLMPVELIKGQCLYSMRRRFKEQNSAPHVILAPFSPLSDLRHSELRHVEERLVRVGAKEFPQCPDEQTNDPNLHAAALILRLLKDILS